MDNTPLLLQAFKGDNQTVPVWFMRQAGRYLPEYQKYKQKYSLDEMFQTPELAAEITCLPIDILGVDAAILFADILTLPALMGIDVSFDNNLGPQINYNGDLSSLPDIEGISYIREIVKQSKDKLPKDIPLIGFAGSPFTVLTYLVEGGSSVNMTKTVKFIEENENKFHQWMNKLTDNTIIYLQEQINAGCDCVQLFDTWAGILRPTDYAHYALPYVKRIFESIKAPSIYYVKNCSHLLALMDKTKADFLSVCHTVVLGHHNVIDKTKKGIQGNLYNGLLYADSNSLKKEVQDVLLGGVQHERYVFNLSHGIFPDVKVDILKLIVDQVHGFKWNR